MKKAWEKNRNGNKSHFTKVVGSISVFLLLCLSWLFGFFYFVEGSEAIAVCFAAFNSLQGVGIFFFSVLMDESILNLKANIVNMEGQQHSFQRPQNHPHDKSRLSDIRDTGSTKERLSMLTNRQRCRSSDCSINEWSSIPTEAFITDHSYSYQESTSSFSTGSSEFDSIQYPVSFLQEQHKINQHIFSFTISAQSTPKHRLPPVSLTSTLTRNYSTDGSHSHCWWPEKPFETEEVIISPLRMSFSYSDSRLGDQWVSSRPDLAHLKPQFMHPKVVLGPTREWHAYYQNNWDNILRTNPEESWAERNF